MTATALQLFDKSVAAVIAQGKPAMNTFETCMYRAPDGTRCALGHLIPDEDYVPDMDHGAILATEIIKRLKLPGELPIWLQLQTAHDQADRTDFVADFTRRAENLRREYFDENR